jgi:ribulose-5-phosphate 4-epimerase/fuculose-1-phosphate aldolase
MLSAMTVEQNQVSAAEWQARVRLAGAYQVFHFLGWTELIFNHISVRVPDQPKHFLLNPYGLHYSEITANNLVKVDVQGQVQQDSEFGVNPAGFVPHSQIHTHLPNAHCVMHTHTTAGMAVASSQLGLTMDNFYSAQLHGQVAYHDFEGITLHADEGPRLISSIGNKQAVILRNHGLLAWGHSIGNAFAVLWTMQRACEVQLATHSMGKAIAISEDVQRKCTADSLQFSSKGDLGEDILDALLRVMRAKKN